MSTTDTAPDTAMLTFRQYAARERRRLAGKYDTPVAEVARLHPDSWWEREWWQDHVLHGFERGASMNPHVWRALPPDRQTRLLRTSRALRDDQLTHDLIAHGRTP